MSVLIVQLPVNGTSKDVIDEPKLGYNNEYHGVLIPSEQCSGFYKFVTGNNTQLIPRTCNI